MYDRAVDLLVSGADEFNMRADLVKERAEPSRCCE